MTIEFREAGDESNAAIIVPKYYGGCGTIDTQRELVGEERTPRSRKRSLAQRRKGAASDAAF